MNRRTAMLIFGIFAIIAVIAIVAAADSEEERGTRAGETYLGDPENNCVGGICHDQKVANWTETQHADPDDDFQDKHGTNVYKDSYCGPCHTLGWNEVELGGFNITNLETEWNSTHNQKMWRIQCENCHGPASDHGGDPAGINIDRDPYTSCYGHGEAGCHSGTRQWGTDTIPGWNASRHGPADDLADPESEERSLNRDCAECKDPSNFDAALTREDIYDISEFRGITCGDCHNPHNDTGHLAQLRWDPEETCDECHNGGHHETMRTEELSGTPSVDREEYPYMEEVSCIECHMFTTGRSVPEPWKKIGHSFEPTFEACVECHTDVYDNLPDVDYNESNATAMAEWDAWNETLQEALDEWEGVVRAAQDRYEDLIFIIEGDENTVGLLEEVEELMEVAEGNGTWTDHLKEVFEQAEFDYELAEHKAKGAHNPAYATALLNAAIDGFEEIIEELEMGTLNGTVTDESAQGIADVYISVTDDGGVMTDSNGEYTITLPPGTYTVNAFKMGTIEQSVTDVELISAAVTTQNFTLAADFDNDGTPDSTDLDDDNDGIPDVWELNNSLNPKDPSDAYGDPDGDDKTNLQEYKDGTDPKVADPAPKGDEEEADTTMYLVGIIVLIIIIILLIVMLAKKGKSAPALPPEEPPREEPPIEEEEY